MVATFLQPIYLGKLLDYFTTNQTFVTKKQAYFYAGMIVLATYIRVLSFQYFILETFDIGLKIRTACSSLIFRKMLNMRKTTIQKVTLGRIVNLLSNDVEKFDRTISYTHCIWIGIVKVIAVVYFLFVWFGYEGLSGTGIILIFLLLQIWIFKAIAVTKTAALEKTDYRIRILNDVISGIQAIKMFSWETSFNRFLNSVRRSELKYIAKATYLQHIGFTIVFYIHKLPVFIMILLAICLTGSFSPQMVFMALNLYDLIRQNLMFLTAGVSMTSELTTSLKRIQEFLLSDHDEVNQISNQPLDSEKYKIYVNNITAKWDSFSNPVLKNLNFEAASGELVAVLGAAGSGKTALLQTLLQEMITVDGSLQCNGSISYAPQEPWVFPATIRQNILFGEQPNEQKYLKVVRVCALMEDISLFPYGDNTLVGERGVMLSGGQKARVSLARAIYRDADIYLLDDPLSAVDSAVAQQIFTECFLDYLRTKTVILVTHQLRFLRNMNRIYILENGEVKSSGTYEEIAALAGKSFEKFTRKNVDAELLEIQNYGGQYEVKEDEGGNAMFRYKSYLRASGPWIVIFLHIALFGVVQTCMNASDLFLTFWINLRENPNTLEFFSELNCLYIYSGLILGMVILYHLSSWTFVKACISSSVTLHDSLLRKVLRGSMNFFNYHSSGRILNRFSRDMGIIDEIIPRNLYQMVRQCCAVFGTCVVVVILNYWIIIPTLILYGIVYLGSVVYQPALNRCKMLGALRKSPFFTHVSTTTQGITTIKALKVQEQMLSKFDDYQNCFNAIEYIQKSLYFAYAFWTDFICGLYSAIIIFYFLIFAEDSSIGNVGLSVTQSLLLIGSAQYFMKMYGELDSQMVSVERVVEYADLVPEEDKGSFTPRGEWPNQGQITFDSVSMQYTIDKPFAIFKVNFDIKPSEKVGIVGRTGSGKSSLIAALFRLYNFRGTIYIDGVDIKLLPLSKLRSKISVIPQDPVFFLGTLRKNLDPFDEFEDNLIWSTLEEVNLRQLIAGLPSGLDSPVLEGGSNFSVGQRQMLCLVRAMLKNSKIIVLDEATANIDTDTDQLIQTIIRRKFRNSTVLTIAHRLDTIVDCDKILVMDKGFLVEFGSPDELLQNSSGYFYKYVHRLPV